MKTITLIIMVAILLEALVEYFKTVMKMVEDKEYKTAITQGVTIVLGIFLAFAFHLQLFNEGLSEFYEGLHINPVLDTILTGIIFSRGANYFSDFVSKLTGNKKELDFEDMAFENSADMYINDIEPQTEKDDETEDLQELDLSETVEEETEIKG